MCETNDPINFNEKIDEKYLDIISIKNNIDKQKDIIGRDDKFKKVKIDATYPIYLLNNIKSYTDWIA